jgi:hypothetical protein
MNGRMAANANGAQGSGAPIDLFAPFALSDRIAGKTRRLPLRFCSTIATVSSRLNLNELCNQSKALRGSFFMVTAPCRQRRSK